MKQTIQYFANHKTRMCRMLSGPPDGKDHFENVQQAIKDGFVEISGPDELDAFRAVTQEAKDRGWNPNRMRYDTWLKRQVAP